MKNEKIKEITKQLEAGVQDIFASGRYEEYLRFLGQFHHYSLNNTVLIFSQMPEASLVAGYKSWQDKHRQVKKGAKAIKILAPMVRKYTKTIKREDGTEEEQEGQYMAYRAVNVFDISQTEGEDIPTLSVNELEGQTEIISKVQGIAPVPVEYKDIHSGAKGYYSPSEEKIVIQQGMSDAQTVKTLVHETAHAILHGKGGDQEQADRETKEVQAESIAYTVCSYLGLDTSDYSLGYIAGWSKGKDTDELKKSMDVIRKTAQDIIQIVEKRQAA